MCLSKLQLKSKQKWEFGKSNRTKRDLQKELENFEITHAFFVKFELSNVNLIEVRLLAYETIKAIYYNNLTN